MNLCNHVCSCHVPPVLCKSQSVARSCKCTGAVSCYQGSTICARPVRGIENTTVRKKRTLSYSAYYKPLVPCCILQLSYFLTHGVTRIKPTIFCIPVGWMNESLIFTTSLPESNRLYKQISYTSADKKYIISIEVKREIDDEITDQQTAWQSLITFLIASNHWAPGSRTHGKQGHLYLVHCNTGSAISKGSHVTTEFIICHRSLLPPIFMCEPCIRRVYTILGSWQ